MRHGEKSLHENHRSAALQSRRNLVFGTVVVTGWPRRPKSSVGAGYRHALLAQELALALAAAEAAPVVGQRGFRWG